VKEKRKIALLFSLIFSHQNIIVNVRLKTIKNLKRDSDKATHSSDCVERIEKFGADTFTFRCRAKDNANAS
jgi:hypothetical protein